MGGRRKTNCSIVIVTYNGIKWIEKCIRSCLDSNYPVHVIVVDNNSTDHTLDLIPEEAHLIPLSENVGFGRANNIGMAEAFDRFDSEFVFLLNQDAYILPDTIGNLVEVSRSNPKFGLISPQHYDGLNEAYDYRFKIYMRRAKRKKIKEGLYRSKFVNAAAWFLTRKAIEKIGGFDPIFFHTGEDDNICQRLRYHKIPIAITDKARILHDRQDRVIPRKPPHLRVANRARIVVYNPAMPTIGKFFELIPLAWYFIHNLTLKSHRAKEKFAKDKVAFDEIVSYSKKYRKLYQIEGIFLRQDYPPKALKVLEKKKEE